MIRVGVLGAAGRMGRMVARAVAEDPELELTAAVAPNHDGDALADLIGLPSVDVRVSGSIDALDRIVDVAVDFTRPGAVMDNVRWAIDHGIHTVVGTTGVTEAHLDDLRRLLEEAGGRSNVVVAPNFAIGAVLMQRFAAQAARLFPAAEIVELHHDGKADAPSGTAQATAERMARARREPWRGPGSESLAGVRGGDVEGIRIHSVRLPGFVAHQEVVFGGLGQTLTIRHDSSDRVSFMPGVVLAVKAVPTRPGLTVGLEALLGLEPEA